MMEKKMKLSKDTIDILKNFSTISNGMKFKHGNRLRVVNENKAVLAQANVKDTFTKDFCVYELNKFLSSISLFDTTNLELEFDDFNVLLKGQNKTSTKYRVCDEEMIVVPPEKEINVTEWDAQITLSKEQLDFILKSADINSAPHIAVQSDGENVGILTFDAKDDSVNTSIVEVAKSEKQFKHVFKRDYFNFVSGSYDVSVSKRVLHLKNKEKDVQYWIVAEAIN
jgi:hypothetical protein